jgi:hypothetical protein
MEAAMSELPNDGDVIEFEDVPAGSLCVAKVRYRVEKKPLDREYLLVDVTSGHASRVMPHEFRKAKWAEAKQEAVKPVEETQTSAAEPLSSEPAARSEGVLDLPPIGTTA